MLVSRYFGLFFLGLSTVLSGCTSLYERALESKIREYADNSQWEGQDLFVYFGGTGVVDSDTRAGSSVAVVVEGEVYLFDCGPGSTRVLHQGQVPVEWLTTVFFTHMHSDHFGDLGHLTMSSQLAGRTGPMRLFGPQGIQDLASGFQQAYAADLAHRIAQHPDYLSTERGSYEVLEVDPDRGSQLLLEKGGLRIYAAPVNHHPVPEALAYRIEYAGRVVVISGDTSYHPPLATFARGADLLIHEAMDKELAQEMARAFHNQGEERLGQLILEAMPNHSSAADAGRLAAESNVQQLILTHLSPPLLIPKWRRDVLRAAKKEFSGEVSLAEDGMLIALKPLSPHHTTQED